MGALGKVMQRAEEKSDGKHRSSTGLPHVYRTWNHLAGVVCIMKVAMWGLFLGLDSFAFMARQFEPRSALPDLSA